MPIHIIPEYEKELHIKCESCDCEPEFFVDRELGEMIWQHNVLTLPEALTFISESDLTKKRTKTKCEYRI